MQSEKYIEKLYILFKIIYILHFMYLESFKKYYYFTSRKHLIASLVIRIEKNISVTQLREDQMSVGMCKYIIHF